MIIEGWVLRENLPNPSWPGAATFRSTLIVSGELVGAASELLLQRDVSRALHRRHETREILLLLFDELDTLLLQL
jgi:hypothetical protein